MLSQALLNAVPVRSQFDSLALLVHGVLLEHGFVCTGSAEPGADAAPNVTLGSDGAVSLQILPAGWNAMPENYTFGYMHPVRGASEAFTVKGLVIGGQLVIHAASSVPGTDLLTTSLDAPSDSASFESQKKDLQEKIASAIVLRLLAKQDTTKALGKALDPVAEPEKSGVKRPAADSTIRRPEPRRDDPDDIPPGHPFFPDPSTPFFPMWTPSGGLLGPRHPAWGRMGIPSRTGGGGIMPRFSPIGPGSGEPDPDHLRVPGPDGFGAPFFFGGASAGRGRGMDPDNMFIL